MTEEKPQELFFFRGTNSALCADAQNDHGPCRTVQDLRFPLLLCVMCCFNNTGSYVIEFGTFAIFFKDQSERMCCLNAARLKHMREAVKNLPLKHLEASRISIWA